MIRVLVLTALVIASGITVYVMESGEGWDGASTREPVPSLPDLRQERLPILSFLAAYGGEELGLIDSSRAEPIVEALEALVLEGEVELPRLGMLVRQGVMTLADLNALPEVPALTIEELRALAAEKELPEATLQGLDRGGQVPMALVEALVAEGRMPQRWGSALKTLSEAKSLRLDRIAAADDQLEVATSAILLGGQPVEQLSVSQGEESLSLRWNVERKRWEAADGTGRAALAFRTLALAQAVDELGESEPRGRNVRNHARFGLETDEEHPGMHLAFADGEGKEIVKLLVGGKPGAAPATNVYVRRAGETLVWRAPNAIRTAVPGVQKAQWLDARVFAGDARNTQALLKQGVDRILLEFEEPASAEEEEDAGRRRRFVFEGRERPSDTEQPASTPRPTDPTGLQSRMYVLGAGGEGEPDFQLGTTLVDQLVFSLSNLQLSDVVAMSELPEHGLGDEAQIVVTVIFSNGEQRNLRIGKRVPAAEGEAASGGPLYYASSDSQPFVFTLQEYRLANFRRDLATYEDPAVRAAREAASTPSVVPTPPGGG